ncbi:MAG: hypothetical protein BWY85_00659 [Firmicutes bacterium ADurb.Bin506]|jgi:hypothetical protein|nr:MAG: hypothetical protein BWY85_00659 [Firmicutes bacterium ADurb.Bin506]
MNGVGRIPSEYSDSDIIDAILLEMEWQEDGMPDSDIKGWWSMSLEPPNARRDDLP